jgi:hypothetical protein
LRPSTLICIDRNQFVFGLTETNQDSARLLDVLGEFNLAVPRLIVQEVTRNLDTTAQVHKFFRLLYAVPNVAVIDEPVPRDLVVKYEQLGLPEKADAVIGAFVEWVGANYPVSDNRHFLHDLQAGAFEVLTPGEELACLGTI